MNDCNSVTPNLAIPEVGCSGKIDPITTGEIDEDPYCLNNKCYEKSTLMQLENGKDPFTRAIFTMGADDDYQPPNPTAIERLNSRQWGYAPTVQKVLEIAEAKLNVPIPRVTQDYYGSRLELRDLALDTWIRQLLEAVGGRAIRDGSARLGRMGSGTEDNVAIIVSSWCFIGYFPLDRQLSEATITEEQKQAFLSLSQDLINGIVPTSVMNIFYLPPFPDVPPAQATVPAPSSPDWDPPPSDDENLDSAIAAFVGDRANTTADLGFPNLDVGGSFLNNEWDSTVRQSEWSSAPTNDGSANMSIDEFGDDFIALQDQAEDQAEEKAEEIVQELENKVAEEDPLARFDSYFESDDSDDDNSTRRRRNLSFDPWERRR